MNAQEKNHPKKGSKTKVMPIRRLKDVQAIKKMLAGEPRNQALYIIRHQYGADGVRSGKAYGRTGSGFEGRRHP